MWPYNMALGAKSDCRISADRTGLGVIKPRTGPDRTAADTDRTGPDFRAAGTRRTGGYLECAPTSIATGHGSIIAGGVRGDLQHTLDKEGRLRSEQWHVNLVNTRAPGRIQRHWLLPHAPCLPPHAPKRAGAADRTGPDSRGPRTGPDRTRGTTDRTGPDWGSMRTGPDCSPTWPL